MHLLGPKTLLQFLPHLLLKPGRDRTLRLGYVETERQTARLSGIDVGDYAVGFHFGEHQVAAAQSLFGIDQRRVSVRRLGQAGQQSGLRQ